MSSNNIQHQLLLLQQLLWPNVYDGAEHNKINKTMDKYSLKKVIKSQRIWI